MGLPRQTKHYGSRRAGRKTALDYDYPRIVSSGVPESVGVLALLLWLPTDRVRGASNPSTLKIQPLQKRLQEIICVNLRDEGGVRWLHPG